MKGRKRYWEFYIYVRHASCHKGKTITDFWNGNHTPTNPDMKPMKNLLAIKGKQEMKKPLIKVLWEICGPKDRYKKKLE